MKFEYYPDDIAAALAELAGETDAEVIEGTTEALHHLKAICENEYNGDHFRACYRLLERVAATVEG